MAAKRLQSELDTLRAENMKLKGELQSLNENTVISSMNDMKMQYEELKRNTICLEQYMEVKMDSKRYFYLLKTVDNINSTIISDLFNLMNLIKRCQDGEMKHWNEEDRTKHTLKHLQDLKTKISLIEEMIDRQTDDHDHECECC